MSVYFNDPVGISTTSVPFNYDTAFVAETTALGIGSTMEPVPISYSSNLTEEVRLRLTQFGDGYSQRVMDGINNIPRKFNVVINAMSDIRATAVEGFFRCVGSAYTGRTPSEYFYWTPPAPHNTLGKWIVRNWSMQHQSHNSHTISATFEEVFDL